MIRVRYLALIFCVVPLADASSFSSKRMNRIIQQPGRAIERIVHAPVNIVRDAIADPIGAVIDPMKFVSPKGIPTQASIMAFVIKHPGAAMTMLKHPGEIPFVPVANAIVSARNAALESGTNPIPPSVRERLRRWYVDDVLDMIRWNAHHDLLDGLVQQFALVVSDYDAITLINVIVFRNEADANDIALWGHELFHVVQYRDWGLFEFARKWTTNRNGVEDPAYARQDEVKAALGGMVVALPTTAFAQRVSAHDAVARQVAFLSGEDNSNVSDDSDDSTIEGNALVATAATPAHSLEDKEKLIFWRANCRPITDDSDEQIVAKQCHSISGRVKELTCERDGGNPATACEATISSTDRPKSTCVTLAGTCLMVQPVSSGSSCVCSNGWNSFSGYVQ